MASYNPTGDELSLDELKRRVGVYLDCGCNLSEAARQIGTSRSAMSRQMKRARHLKLLPDEPHPPNPPAGMEPSGVSVMYKDGEEILRWEKHKADDAAREVAMEETIRAFMEPLKGKYRPTRPPRIDTKDFMVGIPIGDCHLGALAWAEETGEQDWDTLKAEKAICGSVTSVINDSPATDECWIWQLGDFLHIDSAANTTFAGTPQDVDTRFPKVVRVGVRTLRFITDAALTKFKRVNLRIVRGNHDPNSCLVLEEAIRAAYENEPRLILHDTPRLFFIHRWEANLFGVTHGNAPKPKVCPSVLAHDAGDLWTGAKNKYVHHGHYHDKERKVFRDIGVDVECHAAPTAPDAWTISQGYRSAREIKSIVYHKTEGEKRRYIDQIKDVS